MLPLLVQHVALDTADQVSGLGRAALASCRERSSAILCTYALNGDVLCLGRYHLVPGPSGGVVRLARRVTGGRVAPSGEGYAGMVLALPHAGSLVGDEKLAPEQILNRYVRGLLGGLERVGVGAFYPGRDRVTVGGRIIATLGLEVETDGATLIEASIALGRSFAAVSTFADRADPSGVVPIELVLPEQGTCVRDEAKPVAVVDFGVALAAGYANRLGVEVTRTDAVPVPPPDPGWIEAGRLASHLDRHALARDMLGVLEVYAQRRTDRVADVRICGDVIAPSEMVARLEGALRGQPVARDVLRDRVAEVLAAPGSFILGVRTSTAIADLVVEACTA